MNFKTKIKVTRGYKEKKVSEVENVKEKGFFSGKHGKTREK